ncbi:hypothetical protein GWI33_023239 [Rhynchophorus ferrugineus]|uniref:non-specific serine/threonine protein kinase n=1 Tax=Rhynchophorus ferrugineus TaxID=354439 RepID=A0A834IP68_RHYFE|nr:hypothetical protein GWI33_023239 [Rhynchophorus ferrugineus]
MANSLKNVTSLLSPKFLSPLVSPKPLLRTPNGERNTYCNKENVGKRGAVRKLEFVSGEDRFLKVPITFRKAFESKLDNNGNIKEDSSYGRSIELNTPNKRVLFESGLEKLRKRTTVLGRGTFGTVFRGTYKGEKVAVKIVTKETTNNESNALVLNHRNIVKTLDIIENAEFTTYNLIIMEYIPNCMNLQEFLDNFKEKNDKKILKKCAIDVTTGLDYCHRLGILHLDLKPKNILMDSSNCFKICDFGNSIKIARSIENFKYNGTIIYTAPEILLGNDPSKKSDIYSLGVIFWQIKYRKAPYAAFDSKESIIYNVAKYNTRPTYNENSSELFTNIFTKCWNADPNLRPNTADILKDLECVQL